MPPLAHTESMWERPITKLRSKETTGMACSAGYTAKLLGKLWPSKRRLSGGKSASVGCAQEIHELSTALQNKSRLRSPLQNQTNTNLDTAVNVQIAPTKTPAAILNEKPAIMNNVATSRQSQSLSEAPLIRRHNSTLDQRTLDPLKRLASSSKSAELHKDAQKMRMMTLCELQRLVSKLHGESSIEEQWLVADEIRRICEDDPIARVTLGMLGAIPPLISLLDCVQPKYQCTALLALFNLAVGNDFNKAAIVKAKAVPKMVKLLGSPHVDIQTAVLTAFLSLSALDGNKAEIGAASGVVAMLVTLLGADHTHELRQKDALRALYNLSIHVDNVKLIGEAGGVPLLLAMVSDAGMADKALATISNFAVTAVGRQALTKHKDLLYAVLIDVMRMSDAPKSQERAVYVLMMIAHHSQAQSEAMAAAGAIRALVELSLLGSPLAQTRATRTLNSFRRAKSFSAPQLRQNSPDDMAACAEEEAGHVISRTLSEKKVVDSLVRQSLQRTMQRITKRANASTAPGYGDGYAHGTLMSVKSYGHGHHEDDLRSRTCSLPY